MPPEQWGGDEGKGGGERRLRALLRSAVMSRDKRGDAVAAGEGAANTAPVYEEEGGVYLGS